MNMLPAVSSRSLMFPVRLSRRVFVADGPMGTHPVFTRVFINRCFDELNLTAPAMIAEVHCEYAAVGTPRFSRPNDLWGQSQWTGGIWAGR